MRPIQLAIALPLIAVGLAATSPTPAAFSQEEQRPVFGEVVDVRLVNVEVWVTDKRGRPVSGLGAADFEVLEDGQPVEIRYFAEIRDELPVEPEPPKTAPVSEGEAPTIAVPPAPSVDPSHLVLYFDDLHLSPSGRKQIIRDLQDFLESGSLPSERVLVMRQEHDLYTVVPFGSSRVQLADALDEILASGPGGGQVQQEKRLAIRNLSELWRQIQDQIGSGVRTGGSDPCDTFLRRAVNEVEINTLQTVERTVLTLDHLSSVISFLAGVPGVKTLLYISDSLETFPGRDLMSLLADFCPQSSTTLEFAFQEGLSRPFDRLSRHANANRVTLYTLQASGLGPGSMFSADQAGIRHHEVTSLQTAMRFNEREGLSLLAAETGGRAIFNRNRFDDELESVRQEMGGYYSLAYEPAHGGDRGEHRIKVRLRRDGLNLRHRRGYRDKGADEVMQERLLSALYLGQVANSLDLRLAQGQVVGLSSGGFSFPLHLLIPADRVAYLPLEQMSMAQIKVQVLARNERGARVAELERRFQIQRPPPDFEGPLNLKIELNLDQGLHVVAVAARDEATMETSYVSTSFVIATAQR